MIICGSPHLWEEETVGEDKNVGWEKKSVGWEVENVGGSFVVVGGHFVGGHICERKIWWEPNCFLLPNLPPNRHFLPPTPHFSPLPHLFPPTNEENHKKFSHKIGSHPTKRRKGLLHHSSSWQLVTLPEKFALEQNFRTQASRYLGPSRRGAF